MQDDSVSMVEKVRSAIDQAICDQDGPLSDAIEKAARAAIEAMRPFVVDVASRYEYAEGPMEDFFDAALLPKGREG